MRVGRVFFIDRYRAIFVSLHDARLNALQCVATLLAALFELSWQAADHGKKLIIKSSIPMTE